MDFINQTGMYPKTQTDKLPIVLLLEKVRISRRHDGEHLYAKRMRTEKRIKAVPYDMASNRGSVKVYAQI